MVAPSASTRRVPLLTAGCAYLLLLAAWSMSNPPFASPDEPDHYIRAIGLAGGELLGRPDPMRIAPTLSPGWRRYYELENTGARAVVVPAGLFAPGLACNAFRPNVSAACLNRARPVDRTARQRTLVGTYEPLAYLLPGLAARQGGNPFTAVRLGRAAAAALCLSLVWLALALVWSDAAGALSLAGLLVAVTPMTVFVSSSLNPNGLEIASSIAFFAALLRLTRAGNVSGWIWAAAAVSGVVLILSRSFGPLWVVLDLAVIVALIGPRRAWAVAWSRPAYALPAVAALALGAVASVGWSWVYAPSIGVDLGLVLYRIPSRIHVLPAKLSELVGRFGWLDARMPAVAVAAWYLLVAALLGLASAIADWRRRTVLWATAGGVIGLIFVMSAWYGALSGVGDIQGRHLLPFAVVVPLLAGELLVGAGKPAHWFVVGLPCAAGALQLVGWYWHGRRQSVGADGPFLFTRSPEWSPPLGWWTWLAVAAGGVALLAATGLVGQPTRRLSLSPAGGRAASG